MSDELRLIKAVPRTLRDQVDQFVVECLVPGTLVIPKPDRLGLADKVRKTLDHREVFYFVPTSPSGSVIQSIMLEFPSEFPADASKEVPRLGPEVTADYWEALIAKHVDAYDADGLLWVTKLPGVPFYRFLFEKRAAPYFLHAENPRLEEILRSARTAIDESRPVEVLSRERNLLDLRVAP